MSSTDSTIIIIPARMAASRLPGKPLADIAGKPIQHVGNAPERPIAPVYVATDHQTSDVIRAVGGEAVITRDDHPSGSDRVFEALQIIDQRIFQTVRLQGDPPEMDPAIPAAPAAALDRSGADLATLVTPATVEEAARPQVVKAAIARDTGTEQATATAGGLAAHCISAVRQFRPTRLNIIIMSVSMAGGAALLRPLSHYPVTAGTDGKLKQLRVWRQE